MGNATAVLLVKQDLGKNLLFTCATPVTEIGTPWLVYTFGEFTTKVMVDKGNFWMVWMQGMTSARPPTIMEGSRP